MTRNVTGTNYGVLLMQNADVETLLDRFRHAERLGFDQVFVADHAADFTNMGGTWFDGWPLLAAAARETSRVRIGTMVANPILRAPAVMAKEAITIDQLSAGRLELGIGTGIFEYDHQAVGEHAWSVKERVRRFAEYVEIVDGVLRGAGEPYSFEGEWLRAYDVATAPGPVQRPRPPIIVGGHAPTVLRVAAERADVWNTNGRYGAGIEMDAGTTEVLAYVRTLNQRLDERCAELDRDPATLRRSMLLDPIELDSDLGNDELFGQAAEAGIEDLVFTWPEPDRLPEFEELIGKLHHDHERATASES